MQIYNIHEAKTNLSKLIEKTKEGEDVIISKAGKPVAKLVAYKEKLKPRDFNDEDEEINKLFYEGEIFPKLR